MQLRLAWYKFKKFALYNVVLPLFVAVLVGSLLGLALKPGNVEAQSYTPSTTDATGTSDSNDIQTPNTDINTHAEEAKAALDRCKDKTTVAGKVTCTETNAQKAGNQDPNNNRVEDAGVGAASALAAVSNIVYPLGDGSDMELDDGDSAYWRSVYASIPDVRKQGLLMATESATVYAMTFSPVDVQSTTYAYVRYFTPKVVQQELSPVIYAGRVAGSSPTTINSYFYLKDMIGSWWLAMFKISTGLFVAVLVVAGIMVILRQKVGQNVVSVYMGIKNIIIGYVGAFLSFGIGAFFFNFSKWLMIVLGSVVWAALPDNGNKKLYFLDGIPTSAWDFATGLMQGFYKANSSVDLPAVLQNIPGVGTIASAGKYVIKMATGGMIGLLVQLFIAGGAIIIMGKILIKVIKVYVTMLIDIILAPLIFLLGSIPGNEATIGDWFKRLFKNSIKVPLIFFIFNFAMAVAHMGLTSLEYLSGGAMGKSGTLNTTLYLWTTLGLFNIIPVVILGTANGVDNLIEQMFGGPSKSAGALAAGATDALKAVPLLGKAVS